MMLITIIQPTIVLNLIVCILQHFTIFLNHYSITSHNIFVYEEKTRDLSI